MDQVDQAEGAVLSVFLVDDDPAVRRGIEAAIASRPEELCLAASAASARQARSVIESDAQIDVSIVDLGLPDGHGADLIARLVETRPESAVLVFTVFGDHASIFRALRAGAHGYLLKDASVQEVIEGVRHAWTGGAPMTPEVARLVVESFRPTSPDNPPRMTPREQQVLELLCHGLSYSEVADALHVRHATVQSHVKSLYRKLDVNSRGEAMKVAIQQSLFVP